MNHADVAVVVIGRNEGARLERCLKSIHPGCRVIYVDSGSTDGSVALATALASEVVELDMRIGFTAARARNAGWQSIEQGGVLPEFIQFVDGDCELENGWLEAAAATLRAEPTLCATFGRLKERFPEKSFYNRLCDSEWDGSAGLVDWCGGNAMFRTQALVSVGGFNPDIIAGEEPDLCLRLAQHGWRVRRIADPMGLHDAAIYRFSQWWKRCERSGHAYLEHVVRHRSKAFPQWRRQVLSIIFWAAALPSMIFVCALASVPHWILSLAFIGLGLSAYLVQIVRMSRRKRREGLAASFSWRSSALTVFTKFAEFYGMVFYLYRRASAARPAPMEYKDVGEKSGRG